MAALVTDRKTDKIGTEDIVDPVLLQFPVEATTAIYGGALVGVNAAGNAVPLSALASVKAVGRAERQAINLASGGSAGATGAAGSISVLVRQGLFLFNINADSAVTQANFGANLYASDDNTISLSDAGGVRPYIGFVLAAPGTMSVPATLVGVMVGQANPYAANPLAGLAAQYRVRNVVTTLAAYVGTGTNTLTGLVNGAFGAQDGVTNVVGDIVFAQGGTTNLTGALDSGPWQISIVGTAGSKYVLVRPDWFTTGGSVNVGQVIDVGPDGAIYAGVQWKSFAVAGLAVIGTNDPSFYVGRLVQQVTLAAGTTTVANVGVRSLTKSIISATLQTAANATGTVGYGTITPPTIGYIGTVTFSVKAYVANMTISVADTSIINILVINW